MTFGSVVREYLDEMGITQTELARRMGTGRQTVNCILNSNRKSPLLDTAISVAKALGVSLQEMVDRMQEDE